MIHKLDTQTGKVTFDPEKLPEAAEVIPLKTGKNNFSSDDIGVRNALNALGFENSKIGYNGKNVTYNGADIVAPTKNIDGTTKTDTKGLIDGVNSYNKNQGIDDYVVDVTNYAAMSAKLPNAVKYHENGTVSIGGVPVENVVIIDGNSYAPKSAIEAAVAKFKQQTGYTTHTEAAKEYLSSTQDRVDEYLGKIDNYAPFAYDPETDPAYQAYKAAYMRNAAEAQENTLAANNARTGGYLNSAAITAGNQAYYNHLDALNDRIPELMDNAYKRYSDGFDMLLEGLEMYGTPSERQKILADANAADIEAMYKALEADYQRDKDNYNKFRDEMEFNREVFENDRQFEHDSWYDWWEWENILKPKSEMLIFENANKEEVYDIKNQTALAELLSKELANMIKKMQYGL